MTIEQSIREQINKAKVMQLATAASGVPWVCNVHFDFDDDLNMYWLSVPDCRHSEEIAKNPQVAVAMAVAWEPHLVGLQIAGRAESLPFEGNEAILHHYAARHNRQGLVEKALSGNLPFRLYRMTPEFIDLIDQENFPEVLKQTWRP